MDTDRIATAIDHLAEALTTKATAPQSTIELTLPDSLSNVSTRGSYFSATVYGLWENNTQMMLVCRATREGIEIELLDINNQRFGLVKLLRKV